MTRRQIFVAIVYAIAYTALLVALELLYSAGKPDRWHAASDVAAVANSIGLPVSLLLAVLGFVPKRK